MTVLGAVEAAAVAQESLAPVIVGTGGVTGVYYPVGGAICRVVNEKRSKDHLFCSVEPSDGSVDNVKSLQAGDVQFAIVQADIADDAFQGRGDWTGRPAEGLRLVLTLYPEVITIISRADAKIANISDLKGKRVNLGARGSGALGSWTVIEEAMGWTPGDVQVVEISSEDQGQALCDNQMDAFVWFVGHPSANTEETLSSCDARVADATGPAVEALLKAHPEYREVVIPAGTYSGQDKPIRSFGVTAELVTSAAVADDVVEKLTTAVLSDVERFRSLHPALSGLVADDMTQSGILPTHPGALAAIKAAAGSASR
ncbi:hypothetical protein FHS85_001292 [Rhodoligotrophos appendicifer]